MMSKYEYGDIITDNGVYNICGKYCPSCKEFKDWLEYGTHKSTVTGFRGICKECEREAANNYLATHRDDINRKKRERGQTEEGKKKKAEEWASIPHERKQVYNQNKKTAILKNPDRLERRRKYDRDRYREGKKSKSFLKKQSEQGKRWRAKKAKYETYYDSLLDNFEYPRETEDGFLEVKCATCREYFIPTNIEVANRKQSLIGNSKGENRLYCSEDCKIKCSVYGQVTRSKEEASCVGRYDPGLIRQVAFETYGEVCEMCGKIHDKDYLFIHHELPVATHPEYELDVINWWVLCKKCHDKVHSRKGCTRIDIRNKKLQMRVK